MAKWIRLRTKVFSRDKYQCQYCRKFFGEDGLLLSAHHIKPRADGGSDDLSNLITLCFKCHDQVELNPDEIHDVLAIKDIVPDKPMVFDEKTKDWHKWIYGGYRFPG